MLQTIVEAHEGESHQASASADAPSPGLHNNRAMKMSKKSSRDINDYSYNNNNDEYDHQGIIIGEKPSRFEVWGWYLYEFCSYFVQTVLIPVLFPLIISQLQHLPNNVDPVRDWLNNHQGITCSEKEINL